MTQTTEARIDNSTLANMAGDVQIETVVQLKNFGASRQFCVSNQPHRQSAKRCASF